MPMCQSPRIAEVLLRAKTDPVNDNCAPTDKRIKPADSNCGFKATRSMRNKKRRLFNRLFGSRNETIDPFQIQSHRWRSLFRIPN